MNVPNAICYFRVLLAFFGFWHFYQTGDKNFFFVLTVIVISLDALDGIAARKLNQATEFGAKLDIYADRVVELAYWLFFALMNLVHIWVFIFFLLRGTVVDYLSRKNPKPLGDSFLRSSRVMRGGYGFFKLLSFCALILMPFYRLPFFEFETLTNIIVYITVLLCFLRAVPVLQDQFTSSK